MTEPLEQSQKLQVQLNSADIPVSYMSSMLRVLQAALREVARGVDSAGSLFDSHPQPVLLLSVHTEGRQLNLEVSFGDPVKFAVLTEISVQTFESFMVQFANFLGDLAQLGLWGQVAQRAGPINIEAETKRRLHELRMELRRFASVTLSYGSRNISFNGNQIEIE